MDNYKLRLRFSKTGRVIYISHLDLMATMHRALIRAGVKLKYSQGFNPHPSISIALPLSVGNSSVCELIDFKPEDYLLPDGLPQLLNTVLPDGINITDAYIPDTKFSLIKWVKVTGILHYDNIASNLVDNLIARFSSDSIIIQKKSKSGLKEINLAPHIKFPPKSDKLCYTDNNAVNITIMLSAQEPSINPQNLLSALSEDYAHLAPKFASFTRVELYDKNLNIFR